MARGEMNREIGNPIAIDQLPRDRRTVLTEPTRILSSKMEWAHARHLIWCVLYVQLVALLSTLFISGPSTALPPGGILWVFLGAVMAAWLIRPAHWSMLFLVLLGAALFYGVLLQCVRLVPSEGLAYLCVAALLIQGVAFRNHYRALAMGGLNRFAAPSQLKLPWTHIVPFFDAWREWLVYGICGTPLPGQFRSPAGSCTFRRNLTIVVLFLVALACHTYSLDLWRQLPDEPGISGAHFLPLGLFLLSFFLPLPVVGLTCFVIAYGILPRSYALKKAAKRPDALARAFYPMLDGVRKSANVHEQDSIPIGYVAFDKSPVFAPYARGQHWWISGSTGAGKTAMLLRLEESLFNRGRVSIVKLDLKSDTPELYYTGEAAAARLKARRRAAEDERPVPTWIYNNQPGEASHLFSPFHQVHWATSTPEQKAAMTLDVMAIPLGSEYGESYYKDVDSHLLAVVYRKYPDINSYRQLHQRIDYEVHNPKSPIPKSILSDANHAAVIIYRLGMLEQLNDCGQHSQAVREHAWDLARFYREECIGYCRLPVQLDPIGSPELARIFLFSLLKTGLYLSPVERKMHVVVICDEWQCFLTDACERALAQARSTGTSLILANQSVADLIQKHTDLTSAVESNCSVNLWFKSIDQKGLAQIERLGGTTIERFESESVGYGPNGETRTVTRSEQTVPRMPTNRVAAAASRDDQFICRITGNQGFACYNALPFVCQTGGYHITEDEYEQRKNAPWPEKTPELILVGHGPGPDQTPSSNGAGPGTRSRVETGIIGEKSLRKRSQPQ